MVPLHGDGDGVLEVVGVVAIGHLVSLLGVQLGRSYVQVVYGKFSMDSKIDKNDNLIDLFFQKKQFIDLISRLYLLVL